MYTDEDMLMLSGIQHFRFCPRQWALIHIEQQWADNRLAVAQNPDLELTYIEPDFGRYKSMEEVASIAKVFSTNSLSPLSAGCSSVNFSPIS